MYTRTSNCELKEAVFHYTKKNNCDIYSKKSCIKKTLLQNKRIVFGAYIFPFGEFIF